MSELATAQSQLARVRASIATIEERGQAVGGDGATLTRANLPVLYEREKELLSRISRLKGRGGRAWRMVSGR